MDNKKTYLSPTTPGLYITFENYVIELMCLNCSPKIGIRFWIEDRSRWGKKFAIEHGKIKKLKELTGFVNNNINKQAIINIVNRYRIKSMSTTATLQKIKRQFTKEINKIEEKNKILQTSSDKYKNTTDKNTTFVDSFTPKEKTNRQKILEHEQKKED